MKKNETTNRELLESINSELFHSFDPEDASWIVGGLKYKTKDVTDSGPPIVLDTVIDIEF